MKGMSALENNFGQKATHKPQNPGRKRNRQSNSVNSSVVLQTFAAPAGETTKLQNPAKGSYKSFQSKPSQQPTKPSVCQTEGKF